MTLPSSCGGLGGQEVGKVTSPRSWGGLGGQEVGKVTSPSSCGGLVFNHVLTIGYHYMSLLGLGEHSLKTSDFSMLDNVVVDFSTHKAIRQVVPIKRQCYGVEGTMLWGQGNNVMGLREQCCLWLGNNYNNSPLAQSCRGWRW